MNFLGGKISRFLFLLKPHKSLIIQCIVGAALYTVLGLSVSFYIEKITDYVLVGGNTNLLNLLSIGMLLVIFFQVFLGSMQTYFMLNTGQQIDARLILVYYKLELLPLFGQKKVATPGRCVARWRT